MCSVPVGYQQDTHTTVCTHREKWGYSHVHTDLYRNITITAACSETLFTGMFPNRASSWKRQLWWVVFELTKCLVEEFHCALSSLIYPKHTRTVFINERYGDTSIPRLIAPTVFKRWQRLMLRLIRLFNCTFPINHVHHRSWMHC